MCDVLAIGPHPDDVELSAGGTVALLVAEGSDVRLLDLTRGERATRGTPELREKEAEQAASVLGVTDRNCLGLPDGGVSARDPEHLSAVVTALRTHRPRVVLTLHWADDHPDHIEGGKLVRRATYLSGLKNYPGGTGKEPFRPRRVLFAMGRRTFTPSLIVDVTRVYETKRKALGVFRSQFFREESDPLITPISDPEFLNWIEARDRFYGGMIETTFGEPFYDPDPYPVRSGTGLFVGVDQ